MAEAVDGRTEEERGLAQRRKTKKAAGEASPRGKSQGFGKPRRRSAPGAACSVIPSRTASKKGASPCPFPLGFSGSSSHSQARRDPPQPGDNVARTPAHLPARSGSTRDPAYIEPDHAGLVQRHRRRNPGWRPDHGQQRQSVRHNRVRRRRPATARFSSWPRAAARSPRWLRSTAPTVQTPYAGLIMDSSGNLYGTTAYGGASE